MSTPNTSAVDLELQTSAPGDASTSPVLTETWLEVPMSDESTPVPTERKQISRRLRYEILRRDGHTCRYCGASAPDVELTVDHVVPVALGGNDEPSNLTTACRDCNAGKTSTAPNADVVAAVDEQAERWASAMRRAAEIERDSRREYVDEVGMFLADWDQQCRWARLPMDAERTIATFLNNGMSIDDIHYAVTQTSMAGKHFRYFCGVCWRIIRERQALAVELLEGTHGG